MITDTAGSTRTPSVTGNLHARMLRADVRRSAVVSATLTALIALATALVAMGTALIVQTTVAIDRLWSEARPPDVVQMHSGEVDAAAIDAWVEQQNVITDHHVMRTLPVPGQALSLAGVSQADSVLEPAFVVAPERFDLLLGRDGPIAVRPGEIALPVHYRAEGIAEVGTVVRVDVGDLHHELRVSDFIRDAQMNPSMVTSKRLVVHPADFAALDAGLVDTEYLIEFQLSDPAQVRAVQDAYTASGLPSRGPAIDSSIFRLMNGLSTMLVAAVALLVAGLLVLVSGLALRYAFLAAIETDLAEISVLKAIGAPARMIKRLYLAKYFALTVIGGVVGLLLSIPMTRVLSEPVLLYLGRPPATVFTVALPILAAVLLGAATIGFCWLLLRRLDKLSATEAMRTGTSGQLRPRRHRWRLSRNRWLPAHQWLGLREAVRPANGLLLAVITVATFIMIVPVNVVTTMEDPRFATYLGVGQADVRIDVRAGAVDFDAVYREVVADPETLRHVALVSQRYQVRNPDGDWESIVVERGDHQVFPLQYDEGRAPRSTEEIALSFNQARAVGAHVDSRVGVRTSVGEREMVVTGIYQDITNGGRTAKAAAGLDEEAAPLWQIIYIAVGEGTNPDAKAAALRTQFPGAKVTAMSEYASQTTGATNSQMRLVAGLGAVVSIGLVFLIAALFAVLVVARESSQIAAQRGIGASTRGIVGQYLTRFGAVLLAGVLLGSVLSATVGQAALAGVLGILGAPGIRFLPNWWLVGLVLPGLLALSMSVATLLALRRVGTITVLDND